MENKPSPPSHVVVYIDPELSGDFRPFVGQSADVAFHPYGYHDDRAQCKLAIGEWVCRHDKWMIRLLVPVSVDIQPVQLGVQ